MTSMKQVKQEGTLDLSVVVPLGSRYDDLGVLCRDLRRVLAPFGLHEVIIVDDANGPATRRDVQAVSREYSEVRVLTLARRMGESAALDLGMRAARGAIIVTVDPYLHVSLNELPLILEPLYGEYDLVCGWRQTQGGGLAQMASKGFNAVARWLTKVPVHDLNCRMRAMRREVLQDIPMYGDLHRFLPIFAVRRGFRLREVVVTQQPGKREVGAFNPNSYISRLLDLLTLAFLTRFMKRPLHLFGLIGMAGFVIGAGLATYLGYERLVLGIGIGHRPLLLLAVLLIVVGVQLGSIGLLGELMIFTHAKDVKDYVVKEERRSDDDAVE